MTRLADALFTALALLALIVLPVVLGLALGAYLGGW
jgi:hypothetical protein